MNYRIFELPASLRPDGKPAIQLLCARNMVTTSTGRLWLGKNFAFAGEPPESYRLLQTFRRFSWHGKLTADYTGGNEPFKSTPVVDLTFGLSVQLDGPDLILDEIHDFDAVHGEFWMIVDDEIMFAARPELTGVGRYKIHAVRCQLGTSMQNHVAGADVYIMRAEDFAPVSHPSFTAGGVGKFKVTLGVQQLSDQEAGTIEYRQK